MAKYLTEIFNLDKPLPTPSLPHMPAIAGAHPLPVPFIYSVEYLSTILYVLAPQSFVVMVTRNPGVIRTDLYPDPTFTLTLSTGWGGSGVQVRVLWGSEGSETC